MTEATTKRAPPLADAKIKVNGDFVVIGSQWTTSKKNVTSIQLDRPVDSFILVNRTPKPKAKAATSQPAP